MDCKIILDLLPLYVDGCCSDESARLIEEHLKDCESCRAALEAMKNDSVVTDAEPEKPSGMKKIDTWKASIIQSLMLFISFGIITVGVALEARTPSGLLNGNWALWLVIPATGFMLSLANWYFVRLYKNRSRFVLASCISTAGATLAAFIWALWHYEFFSVEFLTSALFLKYYFAPGACLSLLLIVMSAVLSNKYAKLVGKE